MTALGAKTPEYAELLAQTLPGVIHSEKENEHFIKILEELELRSAKWTQAEEKIGRTAHTLNRKIWLLPLKCCES